MVRPLDARHEPRQSLCAALLPAVGRLVDRIRRPGRIPRRYLPLQREGSDERVVRLGTPRVPGAEHRGRVLDIVDSAAGLLAVRQREQGRIRLAPPLDHGLSAAGGHLPRGADRLAPLGRGHDPHLRLSLARLRLPRPLENDDLRRQPRHGPHRRRGAQEPRAAETRHDDARHHARHPADLRRRRDDVHLEGPLAGTRRTARRFPGRLDRRCEESLHGRRAHGARKGALRLHAAALPVAQGQIRDPQRPHDALPLARQHLRLLPL